MPYHVHREKTKEQVRSLRLKGKSYGEIAKKTNVPAPTVGNWLRLWSKKDKALKKIRLKAGPKRK